MQVAREIWLHAQLCHPAVISLYAAWKEGPYIYIALEWADEVGQGGHACMCVHANLMCACRIALCAHELLCMHSISLELIAHACTVADASQCAHRCAH